MEKCHKRLFHALLWAIPFMLYGLFLPFMNEWHGSEFVGVNKRCMGNPHRLDPFGTPTNLSLDSEVKVYVILAASIMSRILYHATQKVAALGLSISNGGRFEVEKGATFVSIQGVLDEHEYKELCDDEALVLEEILYCQVELSCVGTSLQSARRVCNPDVDEKVKKKRLLNHDFLILKLQPGAPGKPAIYITAEKGGSGADGSKAGIHIAVFEGDIKDMKRDCCLLRIECLSQIRLHDLTAILAKEGPDYDFTNDNCWRYALETTKFLLEECIRQKSDGAREDRKSLQKELKNLEHNIMKKHLVNTGKWIVKFGHKVLSCNTPTLF